MFPGGRELVVPMSKRFVVTGGPGGGKTTLLDALAARGHRVAPEAARRIIKKRLAAGLSPRPSPAPPVSGQSRASMSSYLTCAQLGTSSPAADAIADAPASLSRQCFALARTLVGGNEE
mgnify:CR=1 FL=1